MTKPSVLVVSGHRSYNDAGNPNEKALTPAMSTAYEKALEAAGYRVTHLQREYDGDADPDDTVGGLDTVGALCGRWMRETPGPLVMLDCHYEGANAPGVFAIVPDKKHLGTAIQVPQPDADQWENNTLDVRLARAIATEISKATGLPLRQGIREPGVMSETQTGVAIRYNARLAMFAYTAPYRDRAVRLVVEHGSLPVKDDRDIIMRPDFTDTCAAAVVRAMNAIYGETASEPVPPPPSKYAKPVGLPFSLDTFGWHPFTKTINAYVFRAEVETLKAVVCRAYASNKAPKTRENIPVRTAVTICGAFKGDDGVAWYLLEDGSRVRASHFVTDIRVRRR
jgi:hypothetical protein